MEGYEFIPHVPVVVLAGTTDSAGLGVGELSQGFQGGELEAT